MVLDAVREFVLRLRHVVDRVAVVVVMRLVVQIVMLAEVIVHRYVRYFHLVFRSLHRPFEMHVRAGHRDMMIMAVQRYHAGD